LVDDDPADGPESPMTGGGTGERRARKAPGPEGASAPDRPTGPLVPLPEAVEAPLVNDTEAMEARARLAEDRLAEVLTAYRNVRTENEGYRDRVTRNIERRYEQRRERLLLKFIEILDNLDRALEAAEQSYAGQALIEGLILVRTQLLQTLQEEGLERIPVLGLPYDPAFSEAVETRAVSEAEHHHVVVKELMRGYRLHGRVARASQVVVGEYRGPIDPEPVPDDRIGIEEAAEATPEHPALDHDEALSDLIEREEQAPHGAAPPAPGRGDDSDD
jgi:molecular chaperone GrpE